MTDAALTSASTYAQVRVREPIGDRTLGETPTIGGEGSDIVVPGVGPGPTLQIERRKGAWIVSSANQSRVRFDGRAMAGPRDLRRHDVLAVGDAQIIVTGVSRTLLRLEVCHLVGNTTISPAGAVSQIVQGDGDEELLIRAPSPSAHPSRCAQPESPESDRRARMRVHAARILSRIRLPRTRKARTIAAAVLAALVLLATVLLQLNSVVLDIEPTDARIRLPGTWLSIHTKDSVFLLPGEHVVRAEHPGYVSAQVNVTVRTGTPAGVRLRLAKLPGSLRIDTAAVPVTVIVDGMESGRAPGVIAMAPGTHTITLRAPHYVDYIAPVVIEGAGVRQELKATLQASWGTLQISTIPTGAHVVVDGVDSGAAPVVVDVPSGVRQIRISAPNLKTWESSVVLRAGEALNVGPIILGQPDATATIRSTPSGA